MQGDPLSMVLYRITLVSLAEELLEDDPGLLTTFYTDYAAFDRLARKTAQLLNLLVDRGANMGYFPETANSLFIVYTPEQEEASKRELGTEVLDINFLVVVGTWGPI